MGLVNATFPTTADLSNQELERRLLVQPIVFGQDCWTLKPFTLTLTFNTERIDVPTMPVIYSFRPDKCSLAFQQ